MRVCLLSDIFILRVVFEYLFLFSVPLQLPQTGYKFITGLAKLGIMQLDQDYTIDTIACNFERLEQVQY